MSWWKMLFRKRKEPRKASADVLQCSKCGASFQATDAECPTCGRLNSQQKIYASLLNETETVQLLLSLKKIRPSDSWLDQEITAGWGWRQDWGEEQLKPNQQLRRNVADYVDVRGAASRTIGFWEQPPIDVIFPGSSNPKAERRLVRLLGRKLVIKWKGTVVDGAYDNTVAHEWRLTVARIDSDEYAIVREEI